MNAPNVRSATVRLDAEVAAYMAKMKAAGQVTEDAFDRAHVSIGRVNDDLTTTNDQLRTYRTRSAQAARDTDRLTASVGKLSAQSRSADLGVRLVERDTVTLGRSMDRTGNLIDKASGRLRLYAEAAAILGPGAVPLGAVGAVGLAGLAGLFGSATVGALGLAAATQGVGAALKAVEKARLDPTVENLRAAREAMEAISPEAREWVRRVQEVKPLLRELRDAGAAGLFPGLTESIDDFERLEPILTRFMAGVGAAGGEEIADIGDSLDSRRWRPFLNFLADEAPDAISNISQLVGDLSHGAAQMWMAFDPGNDRFVDWALNVADSFDKWASSEQGRQDVAAFLDYAAKNGPKVEDFFVATADAITQLVQAAAPLGGPTLQILTAVAESTAALADSDIGTPALAGLAAYAALNRVLLITSSLQGKVAATGAAGAAGARGGLFASLSTGAAATRGAVKNIRSDMAVLGPSYAAAATKSERLGTASRSLATNLGTVVKANGRVVTSAAAMAAVMSGAADDVNLSNTAMGAMIHPLAIIPGYMLDVKAATDAMGDALDNADLALKSGDLKMMETALADLEKQSKATRESLQTSGVGDFLSEQIDPAAVGARWKEGWAWVTSGESPMQQAEAQMASLRSEIEFTKTVTGGGWNTSGMELFYRGLGFTADEAHRAASGVADFRREVQRALGILDQQEAIDAFHESIDNARQSFKEFGKGLDETKNSGRQNRAALRDIARSALEAAEGLKGLDRVNFLDNAADQIAKWAEKMGMGEQAAARFARRVLGLNNVSGTPTVDLKDQKGRQKVMRMLAQMDLLDGMHADPAVDLLIQQFIKGKVSVEQMMRFLNGLNASPGVHVNEGPAISSINAVESRLNGLNGNEAHTYVYTHFRTTGSGQGQAASPNDAPRGADGMTVPGPRYPYADKTLILAAPGEEIISNRYGQADRFRADRAAGRIPRYAGGGTVGAQSMVFTRSKSDNEADKQVRHEAENRKRLNSRLKESEKAVEKERRQRDALVNRMDQIRSGLTSGLRTDLGTSSDFDPWAGQAGGTLAGNLSIIRGDTAEAQRVRRLIRILREKGFDGAAFEDLLARGDVDEIANFASGSRADLARYERAFGKREHELRVASRQGADAALGKQLDVANDELRGATRELRQIKAHVKQANKDRQEEHGKDRSAQQRGARRGARSRRRT